MHRLNSGMVNVHAVSSAAPPALRTLCSRRASPLRCAYKGGRVNSVARLKTADRLHDGAQGWGALHPHVACRPRHAAARPAVALRQDDRQRRGGPARRPRRRRPLPRVGRRRCLLASLLLLLCRQLGAQHAQRKLAQACRPHLRHTTRTAPPTNQKRSAQVDTGSSPDRCCVGKQWPDHAASTALSHSAARSPQPVPCQLSTHLLEVLIRGEPRPRPRQRLVQGIQSVLHRQISRLHLQRLP